MMTELEMALTLGLLVEPEKNFVSSSASSLLQSQILHLQDTFSIMKDQVEEIGRADETAFWTKLLPWHSLN